MFRRKSVVFTLVFLMLFSCFLSVNVFAMSRTIDATVGTPVWVVIDMVEGDTLHSWEYVSGSLGPGLSMGENDNCVIVHGTPEAAGTYQAIYDLEGDDHYYPLTVTVNVAEAPPPPTVPPTVPPTETPVTPSPEPTAVAPTTAPVITKNPTGETVTEGGSAIFIAKATGQVTSSVWRLVSSDTTKTVEYPSMTGYFAGLGVSEAVSYDSATDTTTHTLTLTNIPASLSGWRAACKFTNSVGSTITSGATITVNKKEAQAPVINRQPSGGQWDAGVSITLSVQATSPDGGTLRYQWYSAETNSMTAIRAITGAEGSTYQPTQEAGTLYYCVGIWNSRDGLTSNPVYSQLVAVTVAGATPSPSPSPSPSPQPEEEHEHSFSEQWVASSEAHWHECSCGEHSDEGPHEMEWTESRKATRKTEGVRTGVCKICGYTTEEAIPVITGGLSTGRVVVFVLLAAVLAVGGTLLVLKLLGKLGGGTAAEEDDEEEADEPPRPSRRR